MNGKEPVAESYDADDDAIVRWMWFVAKLFGAWSGAGFALSYTVDPQFVNMGAGVGVWAVVLGIMAAGMERMFFR